MLAAVPGVELVLAARGLGALNGLQRSLAVKGGACQVSVQVFDRTRPNDLAALRPWLVVDAAGPFQDSDYALALAAVGAGAHYIDLSDGRAFVAAFPEALKAAALKARVTAVTGAS